MSHLSRPGEVSRRRSGGRHRGVSAEAANPGGAPDNANVNANVRNFRQITGGWIGCVLLAASFVQFFLTRTSIALPWPTALLTYATVALAGTVIQGRAWQRCGSSAPARSLDGNGRDPHRCRPTPSGIVVRGSNARGTHAWISALSWRCLPRKILEPAFVAGQIGVALAAALIVLARCRCARGSPLI